MKSSKMKAAVLLLAAGAIVALTSWTLAGQQPPTAPGPNVAGRLGLASGERALIIHADDAGVTHSVNQAIETMFEAGAISSASIIVPSPWFPEIAAFARAHPQYDFGVHLALTSEWQYLRWAGASPSDRIPSLLDAQGFLWASAEDAARHDRLDQVRAELRAQIERARKFGVPITHLDAHMDTLLESPQLFHLYLDLGREYHLPVLLTRNADPGKNPAWLNSAVAGSPWRVVIPFEHGGSFPGPAGDLSEFPDYYRGVVENMKPQQIAQIVIHPGIDNDELRAAMGNGSWGASWRGTDYRTFSSAAMQNFLKRQKARLVTWKQVGRAFRP